MTVVEGVDLRLPAAAAAAVVLGVSAGDGFVAVVALLVAAGPVAGAAAALAMAATVARWGTADLGAIAGDQAVLGAAVGTGSAALMASSGLAAAALVLVARRPGDVDGAGWTSLAGPVALGTGAAVLAAGPSPVGTAELLGRAAAMVVGVAAAVGVGVLVRRRPSLDGRLAVVGIGAGALGLVLAILG